MSLLTHEPTSAILAFCDPTSVLFPHRAMNLRKVYHYLPQKLNDVLLRFSVGAGVRYNGVCQISDDLEECASCMGE